MATAYDLPELLKAAPGYYAQGGDPTLYESYYGKLPSWAQFVPEGAQTGWTVGDELRGVDPGFANSANLALIGMGQNGEYLVKRKTADKEGTVFAYAPQADGTYKLSDPLRTEEWDTNTGYLEDPTMLAMLAAVATIGAGAAGAFGAAGASGSGAGAAAGAAAPGEAAGAFSGSALTGGGAAAGGAAAGAAAGAAGTGLTVGEMLGIGSAVVGAGAGIYQGVQQQKALDEAAKQTQAALDAQRDAMNQQTTILQEAIKPSQPQQAGRTPEAFRRANKRSGLLGVSGTLLTGPSGIPPGLVSTGKTLLGS